MSSNRFITLADLREDSIQPRVGLNTDAVARYAAQMAVAGEGVADLSGESWPVLVVFEDADEAGHGRLWLADGFHRAAAARSIGAQTFQARVRPGGQIAALHYALATNQKHGQPLSNDDKNRIVSLALQDPAWAEFSDGVLAKKLQVSQPLVSRHRRELELQGRVKAAAERRGADGKMYPVRPAPAIEREEVKTVLTSTIPAGEQIGVEDVIAAQAQADAERAASRVAISKTVAQVVTPASLKAAGVPVGAVVDPGAHQSRDDVSSDADASGDDWSTPPWLIELCCDVVGLFDLDPASNEAARKVVGARHYFTKLTNGLDKTWTGNVWLNPPYSRDLIKEFAAKAVSEWGRCNVKMMFILVNTSSSASWWHQLARAATLTIFLPKRVDFWHPDGRTSNGGRYDQTLFFFSLDPKRIAMCRKVFSDAGALIVETIEEDD